MPKIGLSKTLWPNMFTLSNLTCGILSLIMTFENKYFISCIFILFAGILDRYDGRIARFLKVSSDLGKELDSLADLVSFGVAPSILLYFVYHLSSLGFIGYIIVLIFPISGAYRLARFNASSFHNEYTGIPITITGIIATLYALITYKSATNIPLTLIIILILSYLMISKIKFKKV